MKGVVNVHKRYTSIVKIREILIKQTLTRCSRMKRKKDGTRKRKKIIN